MYDHLLAWYIGRPNFEHYIDCPQYGFKSKQKTLVKILEPELFGEHGVGNIACFYCKGSMPGESSDCGIAFFEELEELNQHELVHYLHKKP